ncbi:MULTISPECIES: hypothetical protein [unclassified Leisingera]|uniref:hypothetical protein n=1 Tax=unclassified Leisingera TaxID=2614906 RepID=UPI0003706A4E|nr:MULTISPECIES: hypothetical protein [unclassified Leisingera]KIC25298.1 hypothetical protein RA23_05330 [Leisingera sp. ANG-S3]KIC54650.1 hypothetical protein RA22_04720 [Leisingera sp. ANG-S]KID10584.1 hypothetical protein GC1_02550 [Leisingera sp. ANG1]
MVEIQSTIFIIGATLTDTLEAGVLVLIAAVIVFDLIVGLRHKTFLALGIFQAGGIAAGYYWALWIASQQDVAGPYAWATVVGTWFAFTFLAHFLFAVKNRMNLSKKR